MSQYCHTGNVSRRIDSGDDPDTVVQNMGWLAHVGDIGYRLLLRCNGPVNFTRHLLGLGHWSLSAYVKSEVKNVVGFIGKFEESVVRYAEDYDAVSYTHLTLPTNREV